MAGKIIMAIIILGIVPLCVGLIPVNYMEKQNRCIGITYLSGTIMLLAMFQLIAVPIVILDGHGFVKIVIIFSLLSGILSVLGIYFTVKNLKKQRAESEKDKDKKGFRIKLNEAKTKLAEHLKDKEKWETNFFWILALSAISFQMIMAVLYASIDGDDAYYVVQSVLTDETNTLYRIKPYTGLSTGMDLRHALAVFPVWIAYLARVTGIHATIMAHTILPLVIIPVVYLVYLEIGKILLKKDRAKLPIFMLFIVLMHIFGKVSIYTGATFFITRTWQGKSLLANLVVPLIIWLVVSIFADNNYADLSRVWLWILLILTNFVAAMSSTGSVFLAAMMIGVTGLVLGIAEKNIQIPLRLMVSCIPLVLYGAIYLLL